MYVKFFKRFIDFILSLIGVIVLLPVFLIIAAAIKIDSKGPIFFKQTRIGKNKKTFLILKFRTMKTDTPKDCPTHLLQNPNMYITRVGNFLRKTSLDELPQLFNILKGDMSTIGPRPALWNQYDLIEERDKYGANDIRPGLTGWAQLHGRDTVEIPEKAMFDGIYTENCSAVFDLKCIFLTIYLVIKRDGIVEGAANPAKESESENLEISMTKE